MSSILKALRKLEDEYPRRTGGNTSWPQTPGVKKTLRRWEINSGRFAPVLWAALTVVVLSAAGWFLVYMRSSDELPAPSAQLPSAPLPSEALQKQPIALAGDSKTAVRRPPDKSLAGSRRRRVPGDEPKARAVPAAAARTPKSQKQRQPAPPLPGNQAELQTGAQWPVLQTGLELQAVSWSPVAENRLAVINGSILREGGFIEGYSVVRIEENEVLMRKGLSQWRLVFNLKK